MGKSVHNDVLDAACDKIATATRLDVCSTEPTTYTAATSTYSLAHVTVTAGDGNGDFTVGEGDVSGRKVTVAEQSDISITDDGDAQHIALTDGADLLAVTTCTLQGLTSGGTVTVPAHDYEFGDPT